MEIDFPRWDDANVDWTDKASIKNAVKRATVNFPNMPDTYTLEGYGIDGNKNVYVTIHDLIGNPVDEVVCVENQINDLAYGAASDSLISLYQKKVQKIQEVIAAARKTIMAHRNLNEDFYRIGAMKVEEVAMCADIEVTADAHVEEIEARIYFELDKFISPSVNFHTLEEMYAKGKTTDEIFDGPALRHGFIDTEELENAKRRKVINVSDLISIIMDIPGVVAVKKIQIANLPEDNDDNIISNTVKWQLKLAYDKNYVPRLSTETSKINFFKGPLPFISHEVEVDALLAELRRTTRGQKIIDAVVDLPEPEGEYKNIAEYVSVQDEFPLVYGIGPEGLPATADDTRKAQAKQLKGFLMFFDQILANYLAQLQGVKELFSMNMEAGLDKRLKFFDKDPINWNSSNAAQRFEFYKSLAAIRHKNPALWINVEGQTNTQLFTDQKDVYAFIRQSGQNKVLVVINFTGKTVKLSASKIPGLEQYMLKMCKNLKTDGVDLYEIGPYGYSVSTLNEPGQ